MKRKLSLLLAFLMLSSTLSACGSESEGEVTTSGTSGSEKTTTAAADWGLPEKDFGGKTLKILTMNPTDTATGKIKEGTTIGQLYAEEESGDVMNDATYKRNQLVAQRYNIQLEVNYGSTDNNAEIEQWVKALLADEYIADLFDCGLWFMEKMSSQGLLLDLRQLPYMNFDQPWWDKNLMEDYSVMGEYLFAFGDIATGHYDSAKVLYFNKDMVEDYKMESPYTYVSDGSWTIDRFAEYVKQVSGDLDGDGRMWYNDLFGYAGGATSTYLFMVGAGSKTMGRTADGSFESTFITERSLSALAKASNVLYDESLALIANIGKYSDDDAEDAAMAYKAFDEGRALFYQGTLGDIVTMRGTEVEFGVIPFPKLDEVQDRYYNPIDAGAKAIAVAYNAPDHELIGFGLEALCAASTELLRPAYIDTTLKTKGVRDDESVAILDMIMDSLTIDIGQVYNFGDINGYIIYNFEREKIDNLVSRYESIKDSIMASYETVAELYRGIYEN